MFHLFALLEIEVNPQTLLESLGALVPFPGAVVSRGPALSASQAVITAGLSPGLASSAASSGLGALPAPTSSPCFRAKTSKEFHTTFCSDKENNPICHRQIEEFSKNITKMLRERVNISKKAQIKTLG